MGSLQGEAGFGDWDVCPFALSSEVVLQDHSAMPSFSAHTQSGSLRPSHQRQLRPDRAASRAHAHSARPRNAAGGAAATVLRGGRRQRVAEEGGAHRRHRHPAASDGRGRGGRNHRAAAAATAAACWPRAQRGQRHDRLRVGARAHAGCSGDKAQGGGVGWGCGFSETLREPRIRRWRAEGSAPARPECSLPSRGSGSCSPAPAHEVAGPPPTSNE